MNNDISNGVRYSWLIQWLVVGGVVGACKIVAIFCLIVFLSCVASSNNTSQACLPFWAMTFFCITTLFDFVVHLEQGRSQGTHLPTHRPAVYTVVEVYLKVTQVRGIIWLSARYSVYRSRHTRRLHRVVARRTHSSSSRRTVLAQKKRYSE